MASMDVDFNKQQVEMGRIKLKQEVDEGSQSWPKYLREAIQNQTHDGWIDLGLAQRQASQEYERIKSKYNEICKQCDQFEKIENKNSVKPFNATKCYHSIIKWWDKNIWIALFRVYFEW